MRITTKQYRNLSIKKDTSNKKVKGARKIEIDGVKFDSRLEMYAYNRLKMLGIKFEFQKKIVLQESFKYLGENIRAITWTYDFYIPDAHVIMDTKGFSTDIATMKIKIAKKYFCDREVGRIFLLPKNKKEVDSCISKYCLVNYPPTPEAMGKNAGINSTQV